MNKIRFKIENYNDFFYKLKTSGAIFVGGKFEITKKYDFLQNKLSNKKIYIKTKSGFRNTLSMKINESTNSSNNKCEIKNTKVEIEDLDKLDYIFNTIGLKLISEIKKYRMVWKLENGILNIDEFPFGVYLEIIDSAILNKIINIFNLNKNQILKKNYWEISEENCNKNYDDNLKDKFLDKNFSFEICKLYDIESGT